MRSHGYVLTFAPSCTSSSVAAMCGLLHSQFSHVSLLISVLWWPPMRPLLHSCHVCVCSHALKYAISIISHVRHVLPTSSLQWHDSESESTIDIRCPCRCFISLCPVFVSANPSSSRVPMKRERERERSRNPCTKKGSISEPDGLLPKGTPIPPHTFSGVTASTPTSSPPAVSGDLVEPNRGQKTAVTNRPMVSTEGKDRFTAPCLLERLLQLVDQRPILLAPITALTGPVRYGRHPVHRPGPVWGVIPKRRTWLRRRKRKGIRRNTPGAFWDLGCRHLIVRTQNGRGGSRNSMFLEPRG